MKLTTIIAGGGSLGRSLADQVPQTEAYLVASRTASKTNWPGNPIVLDLDLTTSDGINKMISQVPNPYELDRCFITMGTALNRRLYACSATDMRHCMETNLYGPAEICRQIQPLNKLKPFHLIGVTSTTSEIIREGQEAAYGAAKAGFRQFLLNLALEWVMDGGKLTHFKPAGMKAYHASLDRGFWETTPLGHLGEATYESFLDPSDVAELLMKRALHFEASSANFDEWVCGKENSKPLPSAGKVYPWKNPTIIQFESGITPQFN